MPAFLCQKGRFDYHFLSLYLPIKSKIMIYCGNIAPPFDVAFAALVAVHGGYCLLSSSEDGFPLPLIVGCAVDAKACPLKRTLKLR